jgi:hypothetical protein
MFVVISFKLCKFMQYWIIKYNSSTLKKEATEYCKSVAHVYKLSALWLSGYFHLCRGDPGSYLGLNKWYDKWCLSRPL